MKSILLLAAAAITTVTSQAHAYSPKCAPKLLEQITCDADITSVYDEQFTAIRNVRFGMYRSETIQHPSPVAKPCDSIGLVSEAFTAHIFLEGFSAFFMATANVITYGNVYTSAEVVGLPHSLTGVGSIVDDRISHININRETLTGNMRLKGVAYSSGQPDRNLDIIVQNVQCRYVKK